MGSKYDTNSIKTFDNEVLEVLFENQLITAMDMMRFAHTDYSLTESAGMKKKIRQYVGTGNVKECAMGEGNGDDVFGSYFLEKEYEVGLTQAKGMWYDEQQDNDPNAVNKMIAHMSEEMTNDMTRKIVKAMGEATQVKYGFVPGFDVVSDAIAEFPDENTEKENLFLLISRKDSSKWRKALADDLKYVEDFSRRGYIGHVCSVPIYWNDAVAQGEAFIGTPEAITVFIKHGVSSESERIADIRQNNVWLRKTMLIALENANKLIRLTEKAAPTEVVTPEVYNTNATAVKEGQLVKINGFDVVAGVPEEYAAEFPLPANGVVMVNLKGIIPEAGATIVQVNPALKAYYESGDENIVKSGVNYIKTKAYDGSDADYQLLLEPKKTVTVAVDGVVYTIEGTFQLA